MTTDVRKPAAISDFDSRSQCRRRPRGARAA